MDVALAKRQRAEHRRALEKLEMELICIKYVNPLSDSCFVEDTAIIFGRKAVIGDTDYKSFQGAIPFHNQVERNVGASATTSIAPYHLSEHF